MGYTLKIGEAIINTDVEYRTVEIDTNIERHPEAPAYGEPTDHESQRWPSYSSWADFCREVGLYELFLDRESGIALIQNHPGAALLTEEVRQQINTALEKRRQEAEKAGKVTSYCDENPERKWEITCPDPCPKHDWQLCRLEWLAYWVNWAVDNCKCPVIVNS